MEKADLILRARYVLTMSQETPLEHAAVAVRGPEIVAVGPERELLERFETSLLLGDEHSVLLPGLINAHTHAPMVYLRGIADDLPLRQWLQEHIWPIEGKLLGPEFIRDATELACLEMLKAGITTYNDMYFFEEDAAASVKKLGMRAVLGAGVLDFPTRVASGTREYLQRAEELIRNFKDDELITPSVAPHAPYSCGPEGQKQAARMAEHYGVPLHVHLAETEWEHQEIRRLYGKSPVRFLDSLGVLSERTLAAHCVWGEGGEIELLAKRKVGVAHCPKSNLKLASGIAPVARMLEEGVRGCLGTDGAASNNTLDILAEASLAARLHKAASGDPTVLSAPEVLKMATLWGAQSLGLADRVGTIQVGKEADLLLLGLSAPHLTPLYNIHSHLVYAARASDVRAVLVRGKVLVNDGKLLSADEGEILEKARWWARRIRSL